MKTDFRVSPSRRILTTFSSCFAYSYRSRSIMELRVLAFFSSSVPSVPRHSPILSNHLLPEPAQTEKKLLWRLKTGISPQKLVLRRGLHSMLDTMEWFVNLQAPQRRIAPGAFSASLSGKRFLTSNFALPAEKPSPVNPKSADSPCSPLLPRWKPFLTSLGSDVLLSLFRAFHLKQKFVSKVTSSAS